MRSLVIAAALAATAVCPVAASAAGPAGPHYAVTMSGTFTSTGTMTESCRLPPDYEQRVTATGTATETATFRTTRPALVYVHRISDYPVVNLMNSHRTGLGTATIKRESTLTDGGQSRQCTEDAPAADCGERTLKLRLSLASHIDEHGKGVVPVFDAGPVDLSPPPLYESCPLIVGQSPFPGPSEDRFTRLSARKLLSGRRFTVRGSDSIRDEKSPLASDAKASYTLRYVITLTPRR